jgi:hypothetical protein
MNKQKVIIFDLDETIGYFSQIFSFFESLNYYFNNKNFYSIYFNELISLYPKVFRPVIFDVFKYLKHQKYKNNNYKIMIYTNNKGPTNWVSQIIKYIEQKIRYKLFDQIIRAFKINGKVVEFNRSSHEKTILDFYKCTKLPKNIEICFIDDVYHNGMDQDDIFYINVKSYIFEYEPYVIINKFLNNTKFKKLIRTNKERSEFKNYMNDNVFYNPNNNDYDFDEVISKKMFINLKEFFDDYSSSYNCKTMKNKKCSKNRGKTMKNKYI